MEELTAVGKSVSRLDALEKVTGRAQFCADLSFPRTLQARVLRSTLPHARIVSIDVSLAERLPGVRCVVTGRDAPDVKYGMVIKDQPVLARDVVRFAGEPVAAVAADSLDVAEEAVRLIEVRYEPLPAVFDPELALSPKTPAVLHPDYLNYTRRDWFPGDPRFDTGVPNAYFHFKLRHGDTESGFREADLVMENRFSTHKVNHATLEPHSTIACPEADGGLTIWSGKQSIWRLKDEAANVFGISPSQVRLVSPYIGGGFGSKIEVGEELLAALMALRTGRPVKLVFSREEVFLHGGSRVPMVVYIKDGVKKDGTLVARELRCILDSGAYEHVVGVVTRNCAFGAVGSYRLPNLKFDSYGVYTNKPPASAYRGFGSAQVLWAVESHMDMLAEKLGMDRVELRRKNILREGEPNATGEITHSIGAERCLVKAGELLKAGTDIVLDGTWRKGTGVVLGNKYSAAPNVAAATVKMGKDGSLTVFHSADEMGQGCNTVAAQITAEEFGVEAGSVRVVFADTQSCPPFPGSTSSRTTYFLGNAIRMACEQLKRRLRAMGAARLNASADELDVRGGQIYVRREPDRRISVVQAFAGHREADGSFAQVDELVGNDSWVQDYTPEDAETGQIDPGQAGQGRRLTAFYTHTAKGVEVAVNLETGEVKVLRCASVNDMGRPINPKMCEQQVEGGMVMSIGTALYEDMIMVDGRVINTDFTDYRVPSTADVPASSDVVSVEAPVPHKDGPYGAKGLGESALIGMEPAIANAVYQAVGVRIKDLPITREKIWRELNRQKEDR